MNDLIARLERAEPNNELDVLVEIALFKPCSAFASIRSNFAGTKVIYTDHEGKDYTHWAPDWSGQPGHRAYAIAALRAQQKDTNA